MGLDKQGDGAPPNATVRASRKPIRQVTDEPFFTDPGLFIIPPDYSLCLMAKAPGNNGRNCTP
jgi:hypothetical protein